MPNGHGAEPYGNSGQIQTQLAFYSLRSYLRTLPDTFEQGRTFGFLKANPSNLEKRIISACRPSRLLIHTTRVQSDDISSLLQGAGYAVSAPLTLMTGTAPSVVPTCLQIIREQTLESGLSFVRIDNRSSRDLVHEIQRLQSISGITPLPGWHLRGSELSVLTLAIVDTRGAPVAVGSVQGFSGAGHKTAMGLAICVSKHYQRRGLGTLLNGRLLTEGLMEFGSEWIQEIVDDPDGGSQRMNEVCGLRVDLENHFLFAELGN